MNSCSSTHAFRGTGILLYMKVNNHDISYSSGVCVQSVFAYLAIKMCILEKKLLNDCLVSFLSSKFIWKITYS